MAYSRLTASNTKVYT